MTAPPYVAYVVMLANVAILAAVLAGLRAALARSGWREGEAVWQRAGALLVGWFVLAFALAYLDVFRGAADRVPMIAFGVFVPIVVGLALLWRSEAMMRLLDAVPQSWLVGVQVYRALGVIFLLLLRQGLLPAQFALPAGWGDVAVGLAAPAVALQIGRAHV